MPPARWCHEPLPTPSSLGRSPRRACRGLAETWNYILRRRRWTRAGNCSNSVGWSRRPPPTKHRRRSLPAIVVRQVPRRPWRSPPPARWCPTSFCDEPRQHHADGDHDSSTPKPRCALMCRAVTPTPTRSCSAPETRKVTGARTRWTQAEMDARAATCRHGSPLTPRSRRRRRARRTSLVVQSPWINVAKSSTDGGRRRARWCPTPSRSPTPATSPSRS